MIHNKVIAMQLIDKLTEVNAELIESILLVKDNCIDDDFIEYRNNIGNIIGRINTDIIDAIVKDYPELEPDNESTRKQLNINKNRQNIINALIIACQHCDEIMAIIKQSCKPQNSLKSTFSFSEEQAQAILELKVPLNQISEKQLSDERDRLLLEHAHFEKMLGKT